MGANIGISMICVGNVLRKTDLVMGKIALGMGGVSVSDVIKKQKTLQLI
jgi:hypothetical protein